MAMCGNTSWSLPHSDTINIETCIEPYTILSLFQEIIEWQTREDSVTSQKLKASSQRWDEEQRRGGDKLREKDLFSSGFLFYGKPDLNPTHLDFMGVNVFTKFNVNILY